MSKNFRLRGEEVQFKRRLELIRVIDEEVTAFMASEEGKGFWGVRKIWDMLRSCETEEIIDGTVLSTPACSITDV